ncbi:MAG: hypothetical protein ICV68_14805 [Pyrinomonadaceae bacterium]|nr:hypothetical protein [Pyrinomonadaceae bacterium]
MKIQAFIDSDRNAIHDIIYIDCSNLRHPQLAFQEEEPEGEAGEAGQGVGELKKRIVTLRHGFKKVDVVVCEGGGAVKTNYE